MFGLSPTKILFTILIIAVVWSAFRWLGRMQEVKAQKPQNQRPQAPKDSNIHDMSACPTCGDFVVANKKTSCGRDNCPYGA